MNSDLRTRDNWGRSGREKKDEDESIRTHIFFSRTDNTVEMKMKNTPFFRVLSKLERVADSVGISLSSLHFYSVQNNKYGRFIQAMWTSQHIFYYKLWDNKFKHRKIKRQRQTFFILFFINSFMIARVHSVIVSPLKWDMNGRKKEKEKKKKKRKEKLLRWLIDCVVKWDSHWVVTACNLQLVFHRRICPQFLYVVMMTLCLSFWNECFFSFFCFFYRMIERCFDPTLETSQASVIYRRWTWSFFKPTVHFAKYCKYVWMCVCMSVWV